MENETNELDLIYTKKVLGEQLTDEEEKIWQVFLQSRPWLKGRDGIDLTLSEYIQLRSAKQGAMLSFQSSFETRFGLPMPLFVEAKRIVVKKLPWLKYAAAALVVLGLGIWLIYNLSGTNKKRPVIIVRSRQPLLDTMATPGRDTVVLELADHSRVYINPRGKDSVLSNDGSWTASLQKGQLHFTKRAPLKNRVNTYYTVLIPPGMNLPVVMPDGSVLTLSADARMQFSSNYGVKGRVLELSGEGDFKVTHDTLRDFIVKTKNTSTRAVGTHFNVNAYRQDNYQDITLFDGEIHVSHQYPARVFSHLIIRTRKIVRVKDGRFDLLSTDSSVIQVIEDRGKGIFSYSEASLSIIMRDVTRWYGVKVVNPELLNMPDRFNLTGRSRRTPLKDILQDLEASRLVKLTLTKEGILVTELKKR